MLIAESSMSMTVLPQENKIVLNESYHSFSCKKLINCVSDSCVS